ncbi:MAG TPA: NrfD/PsrC family molybdoenzyme membrane anchor subunit [Dehalococcoidia bacterium]|nr:NrfD/PsrC family molybdoenzyme membrane anchor subunit [Thermoleophilia bacterium]HLE79852.1 NrfD/PsrC family molybdoenzyme membrane anchor subunit [Dehalococcoidia bacterium]
MLENAFRGGRRYWILLGVWVLLILLGLVFYGQQLTQGLTITGMSRDVTWGLYIAQFTFLVGVAASAVMVVLPYYLHNYKAFGKMVILGEFLAVSAVVMCGLFIFVDMGQPMRVANVLLYPTLNSMMFWDMVALSGYLVLNFVIGMVTFDAERKGAPAPTWVKPLVYLSIPWAVSIHTVTAFLYSGLEARPFWMTAILAPRFLASAFASGPALLVLLALILRKYTRFDPGKEAIQKLATIVTYAMAINLFFVLVELFTALYSNMPHHVHPFEYLFVGLHGHAALAPWMWVCELLTVGCVVLLLVPNVRRQEKYLAMLCALVIVAIWIEKGMAMVVTGFVPSPLGKVTEYAPTPPEIAITVGVYAVGFLVLTMLYKMVLSVRERLEVT